MEVITILPNTFDALVSDYISSIHQILFTILLISFCFFSLLFLNVRFLLTRYSRYRSHNSKIIEDNLSGYSPRYSDAELISLRSVVFSYFIGFPWFYVLSYICVFFASEAFSIYLTRVPASNIEASKTISLLIDNPQFLNTNSRYYILPNSDEEVLTPLDDISPNVYKVYISEK